MRQRRSVITIGLVHQVAAAALLAGCGEDDALNRMAQGPTQAQVCADKDGVIVSDEMCQGLTPNNTPVGQGGHSTSFIPYGWYHYPYSSGMGYRPGEQIPPSASRAPLPGLSAVKPNAGPTGGFGSGKGATGSTGGFGGSYAGGGGAGE